jgi:hypothetical protein
VAGPPRCWCAIAERSGVTWYVRVLSPGEAWTLVKVLMSRCLIMRRCVLTCSGSVWSTRDGRISLHRDAAMKTWCGPCGGSSRDARWAILGLDRVGLPGGGPLGEMTWTSAVD